ncbi:MAG: hypothetical protein ACFNXZ_02440, partial [Lautropia mirabilis]
SILRRINIRILIIPDGHQGMPWEQHDLIKKDRTPTALARSSATNAPRIKTNIFQCHILTLVRPIS